MNFKRLFLLCLVSCTSWAVQAQHSAVQLCFRTEYIGCLNDWTPSNVKIVSTAQGFAVKGNLGFLFRNKGQCNIVDLKKKRLVRVFNLNGNKSHCNNVNFGIEKYNKESELPLLYISSCLGDRVCYVTNLHTDGRNQVIQKIFFDTADSLKWQDWILDAPNKTIYAY